MLNIAHITDSGKIQSLEDHLKGVSDLAGQYCSKIGLKHVGQLLGLLHDIGKASEDFTDYITLNESKFNRGDIDHSSAGAQYLNKLEPRPTHENINEIYAYNMIESAIMSHHSGLVNFVSVSGDSEFLNRLKKSDDKTYLNEAISRIDPAILDKISDVQVIAISEMSAYIDNILHESLDSNEKYFRLGLLNKYLLSCLADADGKDTASFYGEQIKLNNVDWSNIRDVFEETICSFKDDSKISLIRREVSNECLDAASRKPAIFTLSVPTGGGKTLSSMRFALNHLIKNGMERIIYVAPYLSIIDQNVAVLRKALKCDDNSSIIAEYHSNVGICDNSESAFSIAGSWDEPIIMTSMVQFLNILYSSGIRHIRKMHNLSNAVIIFDEIQTLPIKATYMFNVALNFLCELCGSTAILCTATQPLLDKRIEYPLRLPGNHEIINDVDELFNSLRRTTIHYETGYADSDSFSSKARELIHNVDSVLVIVNTKSFAYKVYNNLKESLSDEGISIYHLSTNMCSVHRLETIKLIKSLLGKQKVVCVSTQLVEAGVDIDFDAVIRSLAGLDSITQAAGRCNRNGKRVNGDVFVMKSKENLSSLIDISKGAEYSEIILKTEHDVLSSNVMSMYYEKYFYARKYDMMYPYSAEQTLFDMLSSNSTSVRTFRRMNNTNPEVMMRQAFRDAGINFKVIDDKDSIVVPYDDVARKLIEDLTGAGISKSKGLFRKLQGYSVNTFNISRLLEKKIIKPIYVEDTMIYCLIDGYYSKETGLVENPVFETITF